MMTIAYVAFCVVGSLYLLFSLVMGHLDAGPAGEAGAGDAAGHGDGAHGDAVHAYGVHGEGHGAVTASDAAAGSFHFPFFSPLALSTVLACVGAYGLIGLYAFDLSPNASLGVALPLALATTYAVTYAGWRLMATSRGTSTHRLDTVRGAVAEIITPIPEGGVGEVAVVVGGQRLTGPAREAKGRPVPRGANPVVEGMVGSTFIVTRES
jgi:hypothetical protein